MKYILVILLSFLIAPSAFAEDAYSPGQWHDLSIGEGYMAETQTATLKPQCRLDSAGKVHFKGAIFKVADKDFKTSIPEPCRPDFNKYVRHFLVTPENVNLATVTLVFGADGALQVHGETTGQDQSSWFAGQYVELSTIAYQK